MKLVLNVKINHNAERIRLKYQTFLRGYNVYQLTEHVI